MTLAEAQRLDRAIEAKERRVREELEELRSLCAFAETDNRCGKQTTELTLACGAMQRVLNYVELLPTFVGSVA